MTISDNNIKIGYINKFDENGFHYTQMVTLYLSPNELEGYNRYVTVVLVHTKNSDPAKLHLRQLHTGDNFATLTTFSAVATYFNFTNNKRLHKDRNTIIRIKTRKS